MPSQSWLRGAPTQAADAILRLFPSGGGAAETLAVYIPGEALGSVHEIVDQLMVGVRSPYAVLDEHGILLINSTGVTPNKITLAGGSYCMVSLQRRSDHWVVVKTVAKDGPIGDVDALRRHQNEAEWLSAVNRFSSRFVAVESIADEESSYTFTSEFFPGYSAAELLFHGSLKGVPLGDILISIYEELRTGLYRREPLTVRWQDTDVTYVDKIRRRRRSLLDYLGGTRDPLSALLTARRIRVNGRECPSLSTLLSIVDSDPRWQPVVRPEARHACHGDLILEDILLGSGAAQSLDSSKGIGGTARPSPGSGRQWTDREIKLVDPNPYNTNAVQDLAKTMLSLWLGYELVYFDMFDLSAAVSHTRNDVAVHISVGAAYYRDELKLASERFMAFAEAELAATCGFERRDFRRSARMASALAALAIPAFHVIAHGRPDRALAFVSLGLLHASYALADYETADVC